MSGPRNVIATIGRFFKASRNESVIDAPKARVSVVNRVGPARSSTVPSVKPNTHPLWVTRGWKRLDASKLVGSYQSPRGAFAGQVTIHHGVPYFYVKGLPADILDGPHGACFRQRGEGIHWIHFKGHGAREIDSGIMAVERLLAEPLSVGG